MSFNDILNYQVTYIVFISKTNINYYCFSCKGKP